MTPDDRAEVDARIDLQIAALRKDISSYTDARLTELLRPSCFYLGIGPATAPGQKTSIPPVRPASPIANAAEGDGKGASPTSVTAGETASHLPEAEWDSLDNIFAAYVADSEDDAFLRLEAAVRGYSLNRERKAREDERAQAAKDHDRFLAFHTQRMLDEQRREVAAAEAKTNAEWEKKLADSCRDAVDVMHEAVRKARVESLRLAAGEFYMQHAPMANSEKFVEWLRSRADRLEREQSATKEKYPSGKPSTSQPEEGKGSPDTFAIPNQVGEHSIAFVQWVSPDIYEQATRERDELRAKLAREASMTDDMAKEAKASRLRAEAAEAELKMAGESIVALNTALQENRAHLAALDTRGTVSAQSIIDFLRCFECHGEYGAHLTSCSRQVRR